MDLFHFSSFLLLLFFKSLSPVWLFATPWTEACQAPLSTEFSRQEYWSGFPFPSPGDLPDPGIEPHLQLGRQEHYHWATWASPFSLTTFNSCKIHGNFQTERGNNMQATVRADSTFRATKKYQFSSVQSLSHVQLFATPWIPGHQASLSITNSRSSLKLTSIKLVMPSRHLILCRPLLLLPPISPSIRVFSNESTLHMRWPKYWSFSFSIIPSKEIPGLMSFRMDWLDLLAVQGTLKTLFQYHRSKASLLWCSAFFTVQLSHPYMTNGKTIALTRWPLLAK